MIVAIDGRKMESVDQLLDELEQHEIGSSVQLTVLRDGKEHKVAVTLEALQ